MTIERDILGLPRLVERTPLGSWETVDRGTADLGNAREVLFDLSLEGGEDEGYFLICRIRGDEHANDWWFVTLQEAEATAEAWFGVSRQDWRDRPPSGPPGGSPPSGR